MGANAAAAASESALSPAPASAPRDRRVLALEAAERRAAATAKAESNGDASTLAPALPAPTPAPAPTPPPTLAPPPVPPPLPTPAPPSTHNPWASAAPAIARLAVANATDAVAAQPMDVDTRPTESVELVMAMGFARAVSERALERFGGDVASAVPWLLEHGADGVGAVDALSAELSPNASREERVVYYGKGIANIGDGALECGDTLLSMLRQIQHDRTNPVRFRSPFHWPGS